MRRKSSIQFFLIFFALLALISLPKNSTEKLRGSTVAMLAPAWQHLLAAKSFFTSSNENNETSSSDSYLKIEKLRLENALIQAEISNLKEMMQQELRLVATLTSNTEDQQTHETYSFLKKRHQLELQNLLKVQLQAIPARVIFRSPASWNSSLWIDVGTDTNDALETSTIAKNSPVLVGKSIIGVIDYVGKKQARVRLITDSGLTPSVRALRSTSKKPLIAEKIHSIIQLLENQKEHFENFQEKDELISNLEKVSKNLSKDEPYWHLAKGEIHGSGKPLWRSSRHLMNGTGFNYDSADGEGPARDLRNGKPIGDTENHETLPILQVGDLLVTTGMDGVFPPDFLVAEIIQVHPLKEGDYYYELDALPTAGNLDELNLVFVIPPVGYDPEERPPPVGWQ